uniref:EF-hand domain-containing protein n=1 Tax=Timema bartmani TaxID=61472 RepID=A0A7R9FC27_9NEOP|nr:unnamed protein product [Timema bartmani]
MDQLRRQDESIGMTRMMRLLHIKTTVENRPFEIISDKENDKLDFASFCRVAQHFLDEDDEVMQKELKVAFRLYDKEGENYGVKFLPTETCSSSLAAPIKWMYLLIPGNGYIPTSSLREILMALDDQLTPDQLDEMIAEIDTDGSGTVDFDEFMEMMTGD